MIPVSLAHHFGFFKSKFDLSLSKLHRKCDPLAGIPPGYTSFKETVFVFDGKIRGLQLHHSPEKVQYVIF